MEVEIITVGYEILEGDVQDTNSSWMARKISSTGNTVARITIIQDQPSVIAKTLREALSRRPSLILVSGGLGPTKDDLTLQGLSLALDRELKIDPGALEMVSNRYSRIHPEVAPDNLMTESRRKMAKIPDGSKPLPNPEGAAPGVLIKEGETAIICLPGVPDELKSIFKGSVLPTLSRIDAIKIHCLFVEGIGESALAPELNRIMEEMGVEIRSYPSKGRIRLKILGEEADQASQRLVSRLGEDVRVTEI